MCIASDADDLFEAGQVGQDYNRDQSVELITNSILTAIATICHESAVPANTVDLYNDIPFVARTFTDILLLNVPDANGSRLDISIMYHETVRDAKLYFIPILIGINDSDIKRGLRTLDCSSMSYDESDIMISEDLIIKSEIMDIRIFC